MKRQLREQQRQRTPLQQHRCTTHTTLHGGDKTTAVGDEQGTRNEKVEQQRCATTAPHSMARRCCPAVRDMARRGRPSSHTTSTVRWSAICARMKSTPGASTSSSEVRLLLTDWMEHTARETSEKTNGGVRNSCREGCEHARGESVWVPCWTNRDGQGQGRIDRPVQQIGIGCRVERHGGKLLRCFIFFLLRRVVVLCGSMCALLLQRQFRLALLFHSQSVVEIEIEQRQRRRGRGVDSCSCGCGRARWQHSTGKDGMRPARHSMQQQRSGVISCLPGLGVGPLHLFVVHNLPDALDDLVVVIELQQLALVAGEVVGGEARNARHSLPVLLVVACALDVRPALSLTDAARLGLHARALHQQQRGERKSCTNERTPAGRDTEQKRENMNQTSNNHSPQGAIPQHIARMG